MITSKERIQAAWRGEPHDHVPFTTWSFGLQAPTHLKWQRDGKDVDYWFTKRLEHIHTLPQPWELEDDFQRAQAWQSIGIDDILDVSIPWSMDPEVTWTERLAEAGTLDARYAVRLREYKTPSGNLLHSVKQTREEPSPGWVLQPDAVPLFEDFNVPRGLHHIVTDLDDIPAVRHLYCPPSASDAQWLQERMRKVRTFSEDNGIPVQAWCAFGFDGLVWLTGVQGALFLAMDHPTAFGQLLDQITESDTARTELAAQDPGIGLLVERGWYASTEFWSPRLLDTYLFPHIAALSKIAHSHGKQFGYVMTTGIARLGEKLAKAGVDVLYFLDPFKDPISVERAAEWLVDQITLVGGISSLQLADAPDQIIAQTQHVMDVLGRHDRFILHPVDSLYPDTPWEGLQAMVDAWKEYR